MVAESSVEIEGESRCDSDFELVFCSSIWNDLPVVLSWAETSTGNGCSEDIGRFFKKDKGAIVFNGNTLTAVSSFIPFKVLVAGADWYVSSSCN